mmetsp:Transcript_80782/g.261912  ORF Transcript_80782/g.261912 Transcript_80782/m.261912 type:complete len:207 (-) Transcript_80782:1342-1962(-)
MVARSRSALGLASARMVARQRSVRASALVPTGALFSIGQPRGFGFARVTLERFGRVLVQALKSPDRRRRLGRLGQFTLQVDELLECALGVPSPVLGSTQGCTHCFRAFSIRHEGKDARARGDYCWSSHVGHALRRFRESVGMALRSALRGVEPSAARRCFTLRTGVQPPQRAPFFIFGRRCASVDFRCGFVCASASTGCCLRRDVS